MTVKNNKQVESTKSSGNVFEDLCVPDADTYLEKANLAFQINGLIKDDGLKQIEAAEILGIDQFKMSALSRSLLDGFSIEQLIDFLNKLDRNAP